MKLLLFFFAFSLQALSGIPGEKTIEIENSVFTYHSDKSLEESHPEVTRAIVTIHGSVRNADTYFNSIWGLSKKLGNEDSTIVIAPRFKIYGDPLVPRELKYTYEGWWIGDDSVEGAGISSFAVIDFLTKVLTNENLFPKLETLIVTGHSAGGHLTQRWALGSRQESRVDIKYIVANPGTYAYLSAKRPISGQSGVFEIPRNPGCAYNRYKYGMEGLNAYMGQDLLDNMLERFAKRDVVYFLGEEDTGEVEQTCQARYQGPHRYGRGVNFKAHVDEELPTNIHTLLTVPGVGHTQYGMYRSAIGEKLLFD